LQLVRRLASILAFSVAFVSIPLPAQAAPRVSRVIDGDTIVMTNGQYVRLLQIDTPEIKGNECYSAEATAALRKLVSQKGDVKLRADVKLDKTDRYGRQLRYLFIGKTNVNLKMVQIGAAAPYFYRSERGQYAPQLQKAAENARAKKIGLWKACPGTVLNPTSALTTIRSGGASTLPPASGACDANYFGCIPVYPPDLDCTDLKRLGLAPARVRPGGKDVHKFDRDGDGVGCEG
jgi:endonuclease YncB( thermonuclease family)